MKQDYLIEKITKNLNHIVKNKKLTNLQVSQLTGVSAGAVSKILNGHTNISVHILVKLATGLQVGIGDILMGISLDNTVEDNSCAASSGNLYAGVLSINNQRLVCIQNKSGDLVGTSNLDKGLDLAETMSSVLQLINESLALALSNTEYQKFPLQQLHVAIVLQSYEFEETRRKFAQYAGRYFSSIQLFPDWQITYRAAFAKRAGISVVADKGVSCSYAVDGEIKKLGGWKFPVYDLGGENWLGLMAIHHTIEAFERYTAMTELASKVLAKFNGKIEKITETCFKGSRNPDIYLLFSDILLRTYLLGEEQSVKIVEQGFSLVYKSVMKIDEILGTELPIILSGSLTDIYHRFFPKQRILVSPTRTQEVELLADMAMQFSVTQG